MCEVSRLSICEDTCAECGQAKTGIRFRLGLDTAFLCWEHFRLLQATMKPERVVIEERVVFRGCSCCHHSCCGCSCSCRSSTRSSQTYGGSRSITVSHTRGISVGESERRSSGHSEGLSESESHGRSTGIGRGRSSSDSY